MDAVPGFVSKPAVADNGGKDMAALKPPGKSGDPANDARRKQLLAKAVQASIVVTALLGLYAFLVSYWAPARILTLFAVGRCSVCFLP